MRIKDPPPSGTQIPPGAQEKIGTNRENPQAVKISSFHPSPSYLESSKTIRLSGKKRSVAMKGTFQEARRTR